MTKQELDRLENKLAISKWVQDEQAAGRLKTPPTVVTHRKYKENTVWRHFPTIPDTYINGIIT